MKKFDSIPPPPDDLLFRQELSRINSMKALIMMKCAGKGTYGPDGWTWTPTITPEAQKSLDRLNEYEKMVVEAREKAMPSG